MSSSVIDEMIQERLRLASLQARIPPSQITVLPNGKQVLFLGPNYSKSMAGHLSLQVMNLENNDENQWGQAFDFASIANLSTELSLEQKLLRERTRTSAHGITSYIFHQNTNQILFQYGPHLVIAAIPHEIAQHNSVPVIKIGNPSMDKIGTRMDPNLTDDGSWIVFTRNNDLWMTTSRPNLLSDKENVSEIRLTFAQNVHEDITAGVADFINEEEFDRYTGYWLCPHYDDIKHNNTDYRKYSILYLEADNRKVPVITIPSMDGIEQHKWPRAGENNCTFKVKVVEFMVPLSCCAHTQTADETIHNINNDVIINDYELAQRIYTSFPWIEYIVRGGWSARKNECWIQYLDRRQMTTNVVLYQLDKHFVKSLNDNDGDSKVQEADTDLCGDALFYIYGSPYINIHDAFKFIKEGVLWVSEHSGFKHLYFISYPKGKSETIQYDAFESKDMDETKVNMKFMTQSSCNIQQLTSGHWGIEGEGIWFNDKRNTVYFMGRRETHLEKHLYSVTFDPNSTSVNKTEYKVNKLTKSGYFHAVNVDCINFKFFSSIYSSISSPRKFSIYSIEKGECITEFDVPHRGVPNKLKYVEPSIETIVNIPNSASEKDKLDKDFIDLHTFSAVVYPPYDEEYEATKQYRKGGYPTVIYVYGGPHVQLVNNSWDRVTGNSRCQLWRSLGYTVAVIDSRGSYNRGLAFEGRIKYNMGQIEIQDQVKLVEYLVQKGLTNPKKVGIIGYSYGGYMSLMALGQRSDIFTVGIAGAPVTLWELYDTGYTERYMGTPQTHKEAYGNSSVIKYVNNLPNEEGRLVIIHGLGDENVHFYHTSKLIAAMVKAKKPYILKIFPGERHGVRKWDNIMYMEKFIIEHFQKMLQ